MAGMRQLLIAQLLLLLAVANGSPVIATRLLGRRGGYPVDAGARFLDGRPVFGRSKTLRGIVVSIVATSAVAPLIGLTWAIGALIGAFAMAGDLLSSFCKRRMGLPPSSRATGLDQLPESLLPLVACLLVLPVTALEIAVATIAFFFGELALSRVLFKLHIRERPF